MRVSRSTSAARLGLDTGLGRKLRGLKVPSDELPEFVERVAARYDEQHNADESFAAWVARADEGDLK